MEWICPSHGTDSFGFAFLCSHLASGVGTGLHSVPDDENELWPAALCDEWETERQRSGGFQSSRVTMSRSSLTSEGDAMRTLRTMAVRGNPGRRPFAVDAASEISP